MEEKTYIDGMIKAFQQAKEIVRDHDCKTYKECCDCQALIIIEINDTIKRLSNGT